MCVRVVWLLQVSGHGWTRRWDVFPVGRHPENLIFMGRKQEENKVGATERDLR